MTVPESILQFLPKQASYNRHEPAAPRAMAFIADELENIISQLSLKETYLPTYISECPLCSLKF